MVFLNDIYDEQMFNQPENLIDVWNSRLELKTEMLIAFDYKLHQNLAQKPSKWPGSFIITTSRVSH